VLPLLVVLQLPLPAGLQAAAPDPCPEPNSTIDRACFLGPGGPASGYLEAADDVDTYVLELPAASALEATLSAPTDDYAIRLLGPEGAVRAVAQGSGTTKQLRQDGLPAGKYYLSVFSPAGGISAADPYVLTLSFAPSAVLSVPTGATGGPRADYVPPPARLYALQLADLGPGFHQVASGEQLDGRAYRVAFLADNATLTGDPFGEYNATLSPDRVTILWHSVFVANYGEDAALATVVANQRSELAKICKVEPTQGWGSEQVYSCSNKFGPVFIRAIVLKHRNVEAELVIAGLEQYATWDHIAGLMAKVERRIWDALK
jgi:hypothetical protein